jgi:hypothetical protein
MEIRDDTRSRSKIQKAIEKYPTNTIDLGSHPDHDNLLNYYATAMTP